MNSKKTAAIAVVLAAVCLLGYMVVRSVGYDIHEHGEQCTAGSGHEEEGQVIELTAEEIQEIGLETARAGAGTVSIHITLAGEIGVNQDRMAHVVPRVEGIVTEVKKNLGDTVKAGQVLAVIESQQLADAKGGYLSAVERYQMAALAFSSEETLWKEKISSEQEYREKKQAMTEAGIEKRSAEQKLLAIGFDESYLENLSDTPDRHLTRFEIKAPFDGTVIEKHIVLGELVRTESAVYVIADLRSVWVDLQVYPKDLQSIRQGQEVELFADSQTPAAGGSIGYVGPIVGAESRTALARVVLGNPSGLLRPGLFVTAKVAVSKKEVTIAVPKDAIQSLEGRKCVFVKDEHGFEPVFVEIGVENTSHVEILSGLTAGQEYVVKEAFALKAKIITSTLDSHAGHGH